MTVSPLLLHLYDILLDFCLDLQRAFRYRGDGEQLAATLHRMFVESRKFQAALDEIAGSPPRGKYYKSTLQNAVDIAVGSYFRYLEQRGRCDEAEDLVTELFSLIFNDPEIQMYLSAGRNP